MAETEFVALMEENGKIHIVSMVDNIIKIKGIGVVNPHKEFSVLKDGEETHVGSKILRRLPTRLPELIAGMKRRAQTIGSKDAGVLIARHGIGADDIVLEAGLGSGGLSMHLARVIGPNECRMDSSRRITCPSCEARLAVPGGNDPPFRFTCPTCESSIRVVEYGSSPKF